MVPNPTGLIAVPLVPTIFENPALHRIMVYDEQRVGRYARAIRQTVRPGDVVVDIGTGTGLLAQLCLQAGAGRVHAIEKSPTVLRWAEQLAEANGLADRITFHLGDSRSMELAEQADLLVCELIGSLAFEEGIVETLLDAKRRFLGPGGRIVPREVTLLAAPVRERDIYPACIDGWKVVRGIDYSAMRLHALHACYPTNLEIDDVMAEPQPIFSADFVLETVPGESATSRFRLARGGEVNGIGLWFDAVLSEGVRLGSCPPSRSHWGQIFVPVPTPIRVRPGDWLRAEFTLKLPTQGDETCALAVELHQESCNGA